MRFPTGYPILSLGPVPVFPPPRPNGLSLYFLTPCRNATGGSAFKFGISLSRDSAMRNPKLNGCSDGRRANEPAAK